MARGAGIADARLVSDEAGIAPLRLAIHNTTQPLFAVVKVGAANHELVLPPREGAYLTARFRETILGAAAHHQQ
jgi:hypothetical protein